MVKIKFVCCENRNYFEEEIEFEDGVTDAEIENEFKEWVWNEIGDRFYWRYVKESEG